MTPVNEPWQGTTGPLAKIEPLSPCSLRSIQCVRPLATPRTSQPQAKTWLLYPVDAKLLCVKWPASLGFNFDKSPAQLVD